MEVSGLVHMKIFDDWFEYIAKYRIYFLSGLLGLILSIGMGICWYYYTMQYEESSLQVFSEVLHDYNQAYKNAELWPEVEIAAQTGYRQFERSHIAPFFLGLQSEALLQQKKSDESLEILTLMLKKLSPRCALYQLYAIKEARMQLESKAPEVQENGLHTLILSANDEKNLYRDQALYYLNEYYQIHDQQEKAQEIWQQLNSLEKRVDDKKGISPWFLLAEQYHE